MKIIGLIGGTSWESSLEYYRLLNEYTKKRLGGLHSTKILMYSLDFGPVEQAMRWGHWEAVARELILGCTEIPMLIKAEDSVLPIIDTTSLHAAAAVDVVITY